MLMLNNIRPTRRTSRLSKLTNCFKLSCEKDSDITVIRMPRSEYWKYFARDKKNFYVGTEPERLWTVDKLEEEFGIYQDLRPSFWRMVESEGRVFKKDVEDWGEKEGLRSSHDGVYFD
ncbi:hypothetical protein ONS95_009095 [Cadophora gregata]|uniref:uncharacterized protein n=1 Tax=Cadophora gregata TaxID=51156 RepID=UPI0026DA9A5D|nr:uncharacterized protein ONS95_009095 [Cadophora gregata]KAK0124112.1 hypothetical protein ONS95_009095 [Cadophora gregata]